MSESYFVLLAAMLFCHCLYDFHIQGILAQMKQRSWWYDQYAKVSQEQPDRDMDDIMKTYDKDYLVALLVHSFEWAAFISIPLFVYAWLSDLSYVVILVMIPLNTAVHAVVDDMKCNRMELNLVLDQTCHLCQIVLTFILFIWVIG